MSGFVMRRLIVLPSGCGLRTAWCARPTRPRGRIPRCRTRPEWIGRPPGPRAPRAWCSRRSAPRGWPRRRGCAGAWRRAGHGGGGRGVCRWRYRGPWGHSITRVCGSTGCAGGSLAVRVGALQARDRKGRLPMPSDRLPAGDPPGPETRNRPHPPSMGPARHGNGFGTHADRWLMDTRNPFSVSLCIGTGRSRAYRPIG